MGNQRVGIKIPLLNENGYLIRRENIWTLFKYNHYIRDLDEFESQFLNSLQDYYISRENKLQQQLDLLGGDE